MTHLKHTSRIAFRPNPEQDIEDGRLTWLAMLAIEGRKPFTPPSRRPQQA